MARAISYCTVDDCPDRVEGHGYCNKHYQRWTKHGDPLATGRPTLGIPDVDRFLHYVEKRDDGCWRWTGSISKTGYARFGAARHNIVSAHRFSYESFVGPIPDALQLDHLCHGADDSCLGGTTCLHRRCVNPAHLEPVTHKVNSLRGCSIAAVNAARTVCTNGHDLSGENLYVRPNGMRVCRRCARANQRRYKERNHAKLTAELGGAEADEASAGEGTPATES